MAVLCARMLSPQDGTPQAYDATVSRVRIDVIVTDDDGDFIEDLDANDFTVYEDGIPQPILDLHLVTGHGAFRRIGRSAADAGAEAEPSETGFGALGEQGALVLVVDGLNADHRMRSRFARAWAAYQETIESLRIPHAAYMIDYLGKVHELAPLTRDADAVIVAAERAFGKPISSETVDEKFTALRRTMLLGTPLDSVTTAARTYDALTAVCDALGAVPGRKALVWVSQGQMVTQGSSNANPVFGPVFNDHRLTRMRQAFHEAANTAGVSVYGLDPALVTWVKGVGGAASSNSGPVDRILADARGLTMSGGDTRRASLIDTSQATGGKAFVHTPDIADALRSIEEDTSRYYLLTYATPEPLGDGEYHEVRVEVRNPELDVRARAGYFDLSEPARHDRSLRASMRFALSLSDRLVVARAYRRWDPLGRPVVQIAATATDRQGRPDDDWAWFHAVVFDGEGWAVDQAHIRVRGEAERRRALESLEPSARWPYIHVHDLSAPPGTHEITVALADEDGTRIEATDIDIEIPKEQSWQTSDLILAVRPAPDSPLSRPLLDGRVRRGEVVVAYVEVRGGEKPLISATVRGPADTAEPAPMGSIALVAADAGIHRGALHLRFDEPGSYRLVVSVTDTGRNRREDLEATLLVGE